MAHLFHCPAHPTNLMPAICGLNQQALSLSWSTCYRTWIKDLWANNNNTSDGQHSRLRRLKNGIPQGSILAPMHFSIYIHDIPDMLSKKYRYTEDLKILLSDNNWTSVESGLTADMTTLSIYLKNWRLKLSVAKTMSSVFHLNNREASHKLNITVDNTDSSSRHPRHN